MTRNKNKDRLKLNKTTSHWLTSSPITTSYFSRIPNWSWMGGIRFSVFCSSLWSLSHKLKPSPNSSSVFGTWETLESRGERSLNALWSLNLVGDPKIFNKKSRRLKGIHSRSDTNRTGAEGLSFYYPRLLHCLNQMLAVVLLSQHRVSSSKTVRPRAPCGARCIGHAISTWSAVCSEAPHSQFGEGARPHLCMDEWNRPTPVRRRLSLTQTTRGKLIPTGLGTGLGHKSTEPGSIFTVLRVLFVICTKEVHQQPRDISKNFEMWLVLQCKTTSKTELNAQRTTYLRRI